MTSKIAKPIVLESYSDNTAYTVGANTVRLVTFAVPTKDGYTLKQITCVLNQNYITSGVGIVGDAIHVTLRNNISTAIDAKITLQYVWEKSET